jgi:hypothetical protein
VDRTARYVVTWRDPETDAVTSVRARRVFDSPLGLSFIAMADFELEGGGSLVVDPAQEALARKLANVRVLHLSIHRVLSIQEVGDDGDGLSLQDRSNLVVFPAPRGPG